MGITPKSKPIAEMKNGITVVVADLLGSADHIFIKILYKNSPVNNFLKSHDIFIDYLCDKMRLAEPSTYYLDVLLWPACSNSQIVFYAGAQI